MGIFGFKTPFWLVVRREKESCLELIRAPLGIYESLGKALLSQFLSKMKGQ